MRGALSLLEALSAVRDVRPKASGLADGHGQHGPAVKTAPSALGFDSRRTRRPTAADLQRRGGRVPADADARPRHHDRRPPASRRRSSTRTAPGCTPSSAEGSQLTLVYEASSTAWPTRRRSSEIDPITYLRPSRYCESDSLGPTAASEFAGLTGHDLLDAVVGGSTRSSPTSPVPACRPTARSVRCWGGRASAGTSPTCPSPCSGRSTCRRGWPPSTRRGSVRWSSTRSPRRWSTTQWWVVDATRLAPRQSLLRVATGRDAADTAFLTNYGPATQLDPSRSPLSSTSSHSTTRRRSPNCAEPGSPLGRPERRPLERPDMPIVRASARVMPAQAGKRVAARRRHPSR